MRDEARQGPVVADRRVRAVGVRAYDGLEELEVVVLEPEPLGADGLRMCMATSTVNPADVVRRPQRPSQKVSRGRTLAGGR